MDLWGPHAALQARLRDICALATICPMEYLRLFLQPPVNKQNLNEKYNLVKARPPAALSAMAEKLRGRIRFRGC